MSWKTSRLSYTAIKEFAKSPNHFIKYKTEPFDSAILAFGRAAHGWILEREKFDEKFAVSPQVDRRTKVGKDTWTQFTESIGDRQAITRQEFDTILHIGARVDACQEATDLILNGYAEEWSEKEIHGTLFGGYADVVHVDKMYAVDLKTCRDASPETFSRDAHNLDYHLQAAIYRHLFDVERFYWIAVEKDSPYSVAVYQQSDRAAEWAENRLRELIQKWQDWDGSPQTYFNGIQTLDLPRWA